MTMTEKVEIVIEGFDRAKEVFLGVAKPGRPEKTPLGEVKVFGVEHSVFQLRVDLSDQVRWHGVTAREIRLDKLPRAVKRGHTQFYPLDYGWVGSGWRIEKRSGQAVLTEIKEYHVNGMPTHEVDCLDEPQGHERMARDLRSLGLSIPANSSHAEIVISLLSGSAFRTSHLQTDAGDKKDKSHPQ